MKKKVSPFIIAGMCFNTMGIALNVVFSNSEITEHHAWITTPIFLIAIGLIIFGIYKTRHGVD